MRKLIIAALVVAIGALAVPTLASAAPEQHFPAAGSHYCIYWEDAEDFGVIAARARYSRYGVTYIDSAASRPQWTDPRNEKSWNRPAACHHRWVVQWMGADRKDDDVLGFFRIIGHSDGSFDAKFVRGGMQWYLPTYRLPK